MSSSQSKAEVILMHWVGYQFEHRLLYYIKCKWEYCPLHLYSNTNTWPFVLAKWPFLYLYGCWIKMPNKMPVNAIHPQEKNTPSMQLRLNLGWITICMLIYSFSPGRLVNSWLQEVRNKSSQIDDNGICACVCHLCKSNSAGICSDLYVY